LSNQRLLRHGLVGLAAVVLVGQAVVLALWPDAHLLMIDLQVYRAGGEHLLRGEPLYAGGVLLDLPFVYPPFAALLFVPLVPLPLDLLKIVWTAAEVGLLGYVVHCCRRRVQARPGLAVTVLLVVVATGLDPVRTTLYLGQINIVLLALVVGDVLGRPESRWRGVGVGIAAAVKLTPLVFVVFLLAVGRRRAAGTALAVFAAAAVVGFVVAPADSVAYWLEGTFAAANRISDVAGTANHSLNGLFARLGVTGIVPWLAAAVLGVVALALAVRAHRVGQEVLALTICGLTSAALAPFAWSHHWVWVVPLVVLLAYAAAGTAEPIAAPLGPRTARLTLVVVLVATFAFVTALPGPTVGPIPSTGLISLQPDAYLLLYLGLLALVAAGQMLRLSLASSRGPECAVSHDQG
jgi:alpha-1,2-mannosyltransferase